MEAFPTLTPVSVLAARRERQAALDLFLSEDEACVSFLKQIEAYWTATWFTEPPPFYEMFEEPYTLAVLMRVKPTLEAAGVPRPHPLHRRRACGVRGVYSAHR